MAASPLIPVSYTHLDVYKRQMLGFVLFLWLLTNFIAVLHGFESNLAVFMAIVGTTFAVSFAGAIVIVAFVGVGA